MGAGGDEGTKRGAALSEEERCTQTKQSGHHHNEKERLDTAGAKGKHREGSATNTPSSPRSVLRVPMARMDPARRGR